MGQLLLLTAGRYTIYRRHVLRQRNQNIWIQRISARIVGGSHSALPFSKAQLKLCVAAFESITEGSDELRLEDLVKLKPAVPTAEVTVLLESFDQRKDGVVQLDEFVSGLCFMCVGTIKEKMIWLFQLNDKDLNKMLTRKETLLLLQGVNEKQPSQV